MWGQPLIRDESKRDSPVPSPSGGVLAETSEGASNEPRSGCAPEGFPSTHLRCPSAGALFDESPELQDRLDGDLLEGVGTRFAQQLECKVRVALPVAWTPNSTKNGFPGSDQITPARREELNPIKVRMKRTNSQATACREAQEDCEAGQRQGGGRQLELGEFPDSSGPCEKYAQLLRV